MHILVSNVYSWQNKGDAGIVVAMLDDLRRQFPGATISLSTYDPEDAGKYGAHETWTNILVLFRRRYGGGRESLPGRLAYIAHRLAFRAKLRVYGVFARRGVLLGWLFPREIARKIASYRGFDLVVACGGGYLLTRGPQRRLETLTRSYDLALFCEDFHLAALFGRPYLLYNQSVGPFFRELDVRVLRGYLDGARAIVCREDLTFERLRGLGVARVHRGYDVAFDLEARPCDVLERHGFDPEAHNLGLTARRWLDPAGQARYERALAGFLERRLAADGRAVAWFMPQVVFAAGGDDDRETAERVRALLPEPLRARVRLLRDDLHPGCLKHAIGRMGCFVGTRMHSNIFALSSGVPTIAIAYEPKTEGIMRLLGLERYVVPIEDATAEGLVLLLAALERDEGYRAQAAAGIAAMRRERRTSVRELAGS